MKTFIPILLVIAAICVGCRTRYDIRLSNGEVITSKGKPHLDKEKNAWIFTDANGQPNGIPAGRVSEVSPQSMDDNSGKTQFISNGSK